MTIATTLASTMTVSPVGHRTVDAHDATFGTSISKLADVFIPVDFALVK